VVRKGRFGGVLKLLVEFRSLAEIRLAKQWETFRNLLFSYCYGTGRKRQIAAVNLSQYAYLNKLRRDSVGAESIGPSE